MDFSMVHVFSAVYVANKFEMYQKFYFMNVKIQSIQWKFDIYFVSFYHHVHTVV